MKFNKIKIIFAFFISCICLCSCSLFGPKDYRGELDVTNLDIVDIGNSDLKMNKTFSNSTESSSFNFIFSSANDVQSFKYRAYYSGTYKFTSNVSLLVYVHSGSIITDWFQPTPCSENLEKNYEYTIEVKLNNDVFVNESVTLTIETPTTNKKDISDCATFKDICYGGDILYYSLTTTYEGKHSVYFNNFVGNGEISYIYNNKESGNNAWGNIEFNAKANITVTIKVKVYGDKSKLKSISGYVVHPIQPLDVTNLVQEKGIVVFKVKSYFKDQEIQLKIQPSKSLSIICSNADVGCQAEIYSSRNTYTYFKGYTYCKFKVHDSIIQGAAEENKSIHEGESAIISIWGPSKMTDNEQRYFTISLRSYKKQYLDYKK